jgi:hypothetical protein
MFHSTYTPQYFSLKQLRQLRDYNINFEEIYFTPIKHKDATKLSCAAGLCSVL